MRPTNRAALLTWRGVMGVDVTGPVTSRLGFSVGGLVLGADANAWRLMGRDALWLRFGTLDRGRRIQN
jgi:hypothetical protein